jgi:tetratricopeptide (TPR) repeat protein
LLKSEILGKKAEGETEFAKAKELMQTALERMEEYEKTNSNVDTKTKIAFLLSRMARATADAKKNEQNAEKLTVLSQDSEKLFERAVEKLKAVVDELNNAAEPDKVRDDLIYSSYQLARTYYEYAINIPADKREPILNKAIKLITEEIEFLYTNSIYCFEAAVIGGLCYKELAALKQEKADKDKCYNEADTQFNMTIDLIAIFKQQNIQLDDYSIELISRAYLFKAQMLVQRRKYPDAIKAVDDMLKMHQKVSKSRLGLEAQMEKANALTQIKNHVQAVNVYNKIIELDSGTGPYAERAKKKIEDMGSISGTDNFDQKITAIDYSISRNRFGEAIAELRKMIVVLIPRTTPDHDKYLPVAYSKLGQCYLTTGRYYEASFPFEYIYKYFPNDKLAPKSLFQAALCLSKEYEFSENADDQKKFVDYLKIINEKYPKDPVAGNSNYIYADQIERKGDLKKAVELYQQVPENAEAYEVALLQSAVCLFRLGKKAWDTKKKDEAKTNFADAEAVLKKAIKRFNNTDLTPTDPDEKSKREKFRFIAFDQLSSIYLHEGVNRPQELMQVVLEAEKSAKDAAEKNKTNLLKIRAYIATDELEKAEKLYQELFNQNPDQIEFVDLCHLIAAAFDINAAKLEKDKNSLKKAKSYYEIAGQYYLKWLRLTSEQQFPLEDILAISDRLYAIGIKTNELPESIDVFVTMPNKTFENSELFKQASFYYTMILSGQYGKVNKNDVFKILLKLSRCYGYLRLWPDAKKSFEDLVKSEKLLDENNRIVTDVTKRNPSLLAVYQELGFVYRELALSGEKHNFASALTVFGNILNATAKDSKAWWINKYYAFLTYYERGDGDDLKTVDIGLANLQRNYPDFDNGKHGLKDKFLSLQKEVKEKVK